MNYIRELHKMKKHREKYFPVISRLLILYDTVPEKKFPEAITKIEDMALILELIDLGYLDYDAFIIKKNTTDITGVYYNGSYPVTEAGISALRYRTYERTRLFFIIVSILFSVILAGFFLHRAFK